MNDIKNNNVAIRATKNIKLETPSEIDFTDSCLDDTICILTADSQCTQCLVCEREAF